MAKLSIIIPCYNESATLARVVEALKEVPLPGWEQEIIVVDDGSIDDTSSGKGMLPRCLCHTILAKVLQ